MQVKKIGAKPWRIPLQNEAKLWIRERSVAIFSQASTEMLWEKEGLTMYISLDIYIIIFDKPNR